TELPKRTLGSFRQLNIRRRPDHTSEIYMQICEGGCDPAQLVILGSTPKLLFDRASADWSIVQRLASTRAPFSETRQSAPKSSCSPGAAFPVSAITRCPIFSVRFSFLLFCAARLQALRHFGEQLVGFRANDEFDIDASAFHLFNRVLDAFESRHGGVLVNRANVQLAVAAPASGHRE